MSHDVTGKAAIIPAPTNRQTRRQPALAPRLRWSEPLGVGAPLTMMTDPAGAATRRQRLHPRHLRRWRVRLRRRPGTGQRAGRVELTGGRHRARQPRARATGWPPPTAACSATATPSSTAPPAPSSSSAPIVGIVATADGKGYYLVAADGGVFAFGDAKFHGSAGNLKLVAPIVGLSITSTGAGYYLVGADGGVFTFGDAAYAGNLYSTFSGPSPDGPAVGIAADPAGPGYLIATAQGAIVSYGGAPFFGSPSLSGVTPAEPLVSVTYEPGGTGLLGHRGRRRYLQLQPVRDVGHGIDGHARHHRERPLLRLRSRRVARRDRHPRQRGRLRPDPLSQPFPGREHAHQTQVTKSPSREGPSRPLYTPDVGASCGVARGRRGGDAGSRHDRRGRDRGPRPPAPGEHGPEV